MSIEQITQHFCIQGWSGIAKWGGVSMQTIVDLVKPTPKAKWVVFYSLGDGADTGVHYDAHPIEQMSYHLTMLAYDMNDEPLPFGHGAPLRLRNGVQLGFKQVKWSKGVEFVADFDDIGGGYNQDHEFFGYRQSIKCTLTSAIFSRHGVRWLRALRLRSRVDPLCLTVLAVHDSKASTLGWHRYVGTDGAVIGMHTFGASAPLQELQTKFGFTPDKISDAARHQLDQARRRP